MIVESNKITLPEFIKETTISGLLVIERPRIKDERGSFQEIFRMPELLKAGITFDLQNEQQQMSESNYGVLRGFHVEPINKLATVALGKVFIAIADLRPDSPTFKKVQTFIMDAKEKRFALYIPAGLANSFQVLSEEAIYVYTVDKIYPGPERAGAVPAIKWNDSELNVQWPINPPVVSARDEAKAVSVEDFLKVREAAYKKYLSG